MIEKKKKKEKYCSSAFIYNPKYGSKQFEIKPVNLGFGTTTRAFFLTSVGFFFFFFFFLKSFFF